MIGNTFYTQEEVEWLGFKSVGENVLLSRNAIVYNPANISIGNEVRIDDFAILSGTITIGSYIHIAQGCKLFGASSITMEDFSGISADVRVYSTSDDYSGESLTNPTTPSKYKKSVMAPVNIRRHAIVGANSTILPGVTLSEGCAIGAHSLVKGDTLPWGIYVGVPAKYIKRRFSTLLKWEHEMMEDASCQP
jgi:acetyltransferase-like isoleucine patch superfamily enzyme